MKHSLFLLILMAVVGCASKAPQPETSLSKTQEAQKVRVRKKVVEAKVEEFYPQLNDTQLSKQVLVSESFDDLSKQEIKKVSQSKMESLDEDAVKRISLLCHQEDFKNSQQLQVKSFLNHKKVPSYWVAIGNCYLKQSEYKKALLFYNKALEVKPEYSPAMNNIGVYYSRIKDDAKAYVAFERAYKTAKFSKTPRYNLALLSFKFRLLDQAESYFAGLMEDGSDANVLYYLTSVKNLKNDFEGAKNLLEQNRELVTGDDRLRFNLSLANWGMGDYGGAKGLVDVLKRSQDGVVAKNAETLDLMLGENK